MAIEDKLTIQEGYDELNKNFHATAGISDNSKQPVFLGIGLFRFTFTLDTARAIIAGMQKAIDCIGKKEGD